VIKTPARTIGIGDHAHFTLRGKAKVSTQWQLYCLVHNVEKLAKNR
jgi:hypothetical protein